MYDCLYTVPSRTIASAKGKSLSVWLAPAQQHTRPRKCNIYLSLCGKLVGSIGSRATADVQMCSPEWRTTLSMSQNRIIIDCFGEYGRTGGGWPLKRDDRLLVFIWSDYNTRQFRWMRVFPLPQRSRLNSRASATKINRKKRKSLPHCRTSTHTEAPADISSESHLCASVYVSSQIRCDMIGSTVRQ